MKTARVALLLGAVLATTTALPQGGGEPQCQEGEVFSRDCNTCRCVDGLALCTKRACIPDNFRRSSSNHDCKPGSRWMNECNWCSCSSTGVSACTLRGCPPGFRTPEGESVCDDGSRWKFDDCNWCTCRQGQPHCSKRLCAGNAPAVQQGASGGLSRDDLPSDAECTPGSSWKYDCNWCSCTNDGMGQACTLMACLPGREQSPEERTCKDGSRWKNDCNWCECVNGRQICTEKFCGEVPRPPGVQVSVQRAETVQRNQTATCTEGSRWRQSCNWCSCMNGIGVCTRRGCPADFDERTDSPECEGMSRWKKDCNWCNCVNGRAICTLRACVPGRAPLVVVPSVRRFPTRQEDREPTCTEGSRWRESCNWCSCRNGISACTKRGCPPNFEALSDDDECEGTSRWKKDCNWCNCVNGRGVCTAMACVEEDTRLHSGPTVTQAENECTEGSQWTRDCNLCRCANGKGVCTRRLCRDGENSEQTCQENSRWKQGCNWCHCNDGRPTCTQMDCVPESDEQTCTEGDVWKDDCNTCHCANGHAACTEMLCLPTAAMAEESPSCVNGTIWSQDCNRCRCINGKGVCTRRLCRQPPVNPICNLPPLQPGTEPCRGFESLFTFDSFTGRCVTIVYGGCGGTENLFESLDDCENTCTSPLQTRTLSASVKPQRCMMRHDSGPCFGLFRRYAFNPKDDRCEQFVYGGCSGNQNNFESAEECQSTCGGDAPVNDPACDRSQCPWQRWEHYIAKNCVPQYKEGVCCPTSFSCPPSDDSIADPTKCIYRGITYNSRDDVPIANKCSAGCRCVNGLINCASIECPSLFRPPNPGCRPLFRPNECCSYDEECGEEEPVLESRAATCTWNNKTYQLGDQMHFGDDVPCQSCVCTPGFTDPFGPGCNKVDCGFEFRYTRRLRDGCVPIFFEKSCCSIDWMCPGDERIKAPEQQIVSQQQQQTVSLRQESDQCHLGNLTLNLGESAIVSNCRIQCQCKTPPEITCVQYRDCEKAEESNAPRDCPEPSCSPACQTVTDAATGCPVCSCSEYTFTCERKECPAGCQTVVDPSTGCPDCKCECVTDPMGRPPCPMDCAVRIVVDERTGCEKCECDPNNTLHPYGPFGPQERPTPPPPRNTNCRVGPNGRPPCPQDCAVHMVIDEETGCEKCECDPNNPGGPFNPLIRPPPPPPPPRSECPRGPNGRPPCPMDCAVRMVVDEETGCEKCECDPNNTQHPFGPFGPFERPTPPPPRNTNCRLGPNGRPPCPMDCAVRMVIDDETGCEKCECDPNNPGSPFGPPRRSDCPRDPSGRPPCPLDCAIRIRFDPETRCDICECNPDSPGRPF